jgi:TM2 domain-containing membrane protein YozV
VRTDGDRTGTPARISASRRSPEVGWDRDAHDRDGSAAGLRVTSSGASLPAQLLALLSDPRVDALTAQRAATTLDRPLVDVEVALDAMVQAGQLVARGGAVRRYGLAPSEKQRLEQMFREAASELGEHGVLARTLPEDALAALEDDVDEPRLPVTAGLLSLFLPGTGQLLNGDVGRASLVFAVWSLAWITHLAPVWTFVCLYAGAEAFFTAKIRALERRLMRETPSHPGLASGPLPPALPAKPSST